MGEEGRPPPLRHAGEWPMEPQQWGRRWGQPCRSPTHQKSKASVPLSPLSPPFHARTHTHTGDTLTTLSTPQWGSHPTFLRSPLGAGEGAFSQARLSLRQVLPSSSQDSLLQGGGGTPTGRLGGGPEGFPKLTELLTAESRQAGAAILLYPHRGP